MADTRKKVLEQQFASAPELTGVNQMIDFVVQRLPADKFPTNARTLIETAQGNRNPITENNFSPKQLAALKELIVLKGGDSGDIQYKDYTALGKKMNEQTLMGDELGAFKTTLGRFKYAKDANGNFVVQDTYDFNPLGELPKNEINTGEYVASGPYGWLREYAGKKIPPGYGRSVKINLKR